MNWLLIRGLVREQRHWVDFPKQFQVGIPDAKIHMIDLPGIGTEAEDPSPATMDGIVEHLRARWLKLRDANPGEWGIFTISLASMAALRWAQLYPQDFVRVVVINLSSTDLSPPWKRLSTGRWPDFFGIARLKDKAEKERRILDMTVNLRADKNEIAQHWATFALADHKRIQLVLRQLSAVLTFLCPRKILPPVLVLRSLGDRLVDPECSEKIARRIGARLATHGLAGHDLPLDDPEWCLEEMRRWLKET